MGTLQAISDRSSRHTIQHHKICPTSIDEVYRTLFEAGFSSDSDPGVSARLARGNDSRHDCAGYHHRRIRFCRLASP